MDRNDISIKLPDSEVVHSCVNRRFYQLYAAVLLNPAQYILFNFLMLFGVARILKFLLKYSVSNIHLKLYPS